jgi:beta-glucosidase
MEDTPAFLDVPGESLRIEYGEGVFVGHRWYDARAIAPRFAFGHGLSYARFEYGTLVATRVGDVVGCEIEVRNTSERAGREVVQLYVGDVESSVRRPLRELAAFEKVALAAGETRKLRFRLEPRAFSYWDVAAKGWKLEPGEFEIAVGRSSRAIVASARVAIDAGAA